MQGWLPGVNASAHCTITRVAVMTVLARTQEKLRAILLWNSLQRCNDYLGIRFRERKGIFHQLDKWNSLRKLFKETSHRYIRSFAVSRLDMQCHIYISLLESKWGSLFSKLACSGTWQIQFHVCQILFFNVYISGTSIGRSIMQTWNWTLVTGHCSWIVIDSWLRPR